MAPAIRADRFPAKRTVFNTFDNVVGTMAVIKRTHDLQMDLPAVRTGGLIHDEVAGVALVSPALNRDIINRMIFLHQFPLLRSPIHAITFNKPLFNPLYHCKP